MEANLKVLRQQIAKAAISILFTIPLLVITGATIAQSPSQVDQPAVLKQRLVRPKPARTIVNAAKVRTDVMSVGKIRRSSSIGQCHI
jgi:hypothetical protein